MKSQKKALKWNDLWWNDEIVSKFLSHAESLLEKQKYIEEKREKRTMLSLIFETEMLLSNLLRYIFLLATSSCYEAKPLD